MIIISKQKFFVAHWLGGLLPKIYQYNTTSTLMAVTRTAKLVNTLNDYVGKGI